MLKHIWGNLFELRYQNVSKIGNLFKKRHGHSFCPMGAILNKNERMYVYISVYRGPIR